MRRDKFADYNSTGELSDRVLEYILLSYLQVENLYSDYTHKDLNELHSEYLEFKANHSAFTVRPVFFATLGMLPSVYAKFKAI